jgi:hypothetical protein
MRCDTPKMEWGATAEKRIAPQRLTKLTIYTTNLRNRCRHFTQQTYATSRNGEIALNVLRSSFDLALAGTNSTVSKQQPHSVQDQKFTMCRLFTCFDH